MSTRLKKPSIVKPLLLAAALVVFQGYLGYSAIGGQFGIESHKELQKDIDELKATSVALQVEIDAYKHRTELFLPDRLDPDILTEQARSLLSMAHPGDKVVMIDPETNSPISSSFPELPQDRLTDIINAIPTL